MKPMRKFSQSWPFCTSSPHRRRGQGYVVMNAQATGEDGRSIVRHRGVERLRTVPGLIAGRGSSNTHERTMSGEVAPDARRIEKVDRDVAVGDVLVPLNKIFTAEQTAVFSRVGEYVRNTHNDLDIARNGKLPTLIVQGQQEYGAAAELMARVFGASWSAATASAPLPTAPGTMSGIARRRTR